MIQAKRAYNLREPEDRVPGGALVKPRLRCDPPLLVSFSPRIA